MGQRLSNILDAFALAAGKISLASGPAQQFKENHLDKRSSLRLTISLNFAF
jgi:hypothetical protein